MPQAPTNVGGGTKMTISTQQQNTTTQTVRHARLADQQQHKILSSWQKGIQFTIIKRFFRKYDARPAKTNSTQNKSKSSGLLL